jgi:hypothetical protein
LKTNLLGTFLIEIKKDLINRKQKDFKMKILILLIKSYKLAILKEEIAKIECIQDIPTTPGDFLNASFPV